MRAKLRRVGYEIPPRIKTIQLNTVSATAVITVGSEYLEKSSGLPDQTFLTTNKPILYRSQKVYVDSHEWEEADDFDASTPYDTHYILNRADGEIIFGNGIHGKRKRRETPASAFRRRRTHARAVEGEEE